MNFHNQGTGNMKTPGTKKKNAARIVLGTFLVTAGIRHHTFARKAFRAGSDWIPLKKDDTVVYSGFAEIAFGASLIAGDKNKETIGRVAAAFLQPFFPVIFYNTRTTAAHLG